jgi:hypothetical protein
MVDFFSATHPLISTFWQQVDAMCIAPPLGSAREPGRTLREIIQRFRPDQRE